MTLANYNTSALFKISDFWVSDFYTGNNTPNSWLIEVRNKGDNI